MADWPQVAGNAQRTGFTADVLGPATAVTFRKVLTSEVPPQRVHPQVQVIAVGGRLFFGTMMGRLYALSSTVHTSGTATAAAGWSAAYVDLPGLPCVMHSAACDGTRVHVAGLNGVLYRVTAATGVIEGSVTLAGRHGVVAAPLLESDNSALYVVTQGGVVYSLDPTDYSINWQHTLTVSGIDDGGAYVPLLMTPAHDGTRVIVPRMDMKVTALNAATGTHAWTSVVLEGAAFMHFWPVVHQGKILLRPLARYNHNGSTPYSGTTPQRRGVEPANSDYTSDAAMNTALGLVDAAPGNSVQSLHVLDAATGALQPAVIHWYWINQHGPTCPPAVDRDGYVIIPLQRANSWQAGWGRLNLATRKIVAALDNGAVMPFGNKDENMAVSCAANKVALGHIMDRDNTNFQGFYNLDTNEWSGMVQGPTATARLMGNSEAGVANPPAIVGTWTYRMSLNQLVARNTA